ncbi:BCCT family transporter [Marinobacterium rhizophilum]|uniref:BCCT family transporter n=1 Tax=Marinobacterium rhizophilum TaxID=420402 RepID=A0ABY5HE97_9GAMM|nr:BCCT family transporter [Marinobacterium rhizophilum]UTW10680.1 BCCT family transporter [Marinobacterium rhizophilum]
MRSDNGLVRGVDPIVTVISMIVVIGFVIFCGLQAEAAGAFFQQISDNILNNFKWFYLSVVTGVLVLLIYLMFSRHGHVRLGRDDERPEFSYRSWLAMLFSGGMGIGLIFWSVAEPMWHYAGNPFAAAGLSDEAAATAMRITFFHWGLHPWAIFIIVALVMAYFAYRKGLPLTMRSVLYPLIGDRIYGPIGHTVDILTVAITAFGVSQSLGLGVIQMNTGLNNVFGMEISIGNQLIMIALISFLAVLSVVSGVGRGIRLLSEWNMLLSILLVIAVLLIGPTRYILHTLIESTGDYASNLITLSTWSDAQADSGWQNWWTAFYWPWWMTWSPFVGMFIARISRGRTIRELIVGALLVPTLVTFIWMSVFGGSALKMEQQDRVAHQELVEAGTLTGEAADFKGGEILLATKAETTSAIFTLFEKLDSGSLGQGLMVLVTLLLATYFITSADSGTLVLCTLSTRGSMEPPLRLRIIWGAMQAFIAGGLLYAGGLKAVQTASIVAGLPIAVLTLLMSISLMKALRAEAGLAPAPAGPQRGGKPRAVPHGHQDGEASDSGAVQPAMLRASGER